jgi:hypothetical protein
MDEFVQELECVPYLECRAVIGAVDGTFGFEGPPYWH